MADGGELALSGGPELDVLLLLFSVAAGGEHLAARDSEPDGTPDVLGGQCGEGHVWPDHRLGAEGATHVVRQNADIRW